MINIAIIDDESIWRIRTAKVVKQYFGEQEHEVKCYETGEKFLAEAAFCDVVFMDIEMLGIDGFEAARQYLERYPEALVAVLTTHTELSRQGYRVNAFRYLDKLSLAEEVQETLESAMLRLKCNHEICLHQVNMGDLHLVVKEILYIETEKRNVLVHTRRGNLFCSNGITELENQLTAYGFYRCHKSYLISFQAVQSIEKTIITMVNGDCIRINVKKLAEVKNAYNDWRCARARR